MRVGLRLAIIRDVCCPTGMLIDNLRRFRVLPCHFERQSHYPISVTIVSRAFLNSGSIIAQFPPVMFFQKPGSFPGNKAREIVRICLHCSVFLRSFVRRFSLQIAYVP